MISLQGCFEQEVVITAKHLWRLLFPPNSLIIIAGFMIVNAVAAGLVSLKTGRACAKTHRCGGSCQMC